MAHAARERSVRLLALTLLAVACARARPPSTVTNTEDPLAAARVNRLRAFIHATWPALTRTPADLPAAARDDKFPHLAGTPWRVYLPDDEDGAALTARLARVLPPGGMAAVVLRPLPDRSSTGAGTPIAEPGLLYL